MTSNTGMDAVFSAAKVFAGENTTSSTGPRSFGPFDSKPQFSSKARISICIAIRNRHGEQELDGLEIFTLPQN